MGSESPQKNCPSGSCAWISKQNFKPWGQKHLQESLGGGRLSGETRPEAGSPAGESGAANLCAYQVKGPQECPIQLRCQPQGLQGHGPLNQEAGVGNNMAGDGGELCSCPTQLIPAGNKLNKAQALRLDLDPASMHVIYPRHGLGSPLGKGCGRMQTPCRVQGQLWAGASRQYPVLAGIQDPNLERSLNGPSEKPPSSRMSLQAQQGWAGAMEGANPWALLTTGNHGPTWQGRHRVLNPT